MADFQGNLSSTAQAALQNGINVLVGALAPDPTSTSNSAVLNGAIALNKKIAYNNFVSYSSAATIAIDPTQSNFFGFAAPAATQIYTLSTPLGEPLYFQLFQGTSGVSSTVTFGTNFKTTGTINTGTNDNTKRAIFQFISDGLNFNEVSRTTFF